MRRIDIVQIIVKKARLILVFAIAFILVPITSASCMVQPKDARVIHVGFASDLSHDDTSSLEAEKIA